jgi:glycerol-3-phosphate O-acyltransferase / dihydroxyacetone phosphate acyltransferase
LTTYLQLFYQDNPELLMPVNYDEIRSLTARMHQEISSRTIDAPSWEIVRTAKLASQIYAPLGTRMSLGDYVRVTRTFVEAFKASDCTISNEDEKVECTKEDADLVRLRRDLKV